MSWARGVATVGPLGYWPWGPGTLASAVVGAAWWALPGPRWSWILAVAAVAAAGTVAAGRAESFLGPDDGRIVIDEAAGMGLALLAGPHTPLWAALAFVLFRLFDILKPPPIGRLQDLGGGWGVMADDLAAGAAAALSGWILFRVWP